MNRKVLILDVKATYYPRKNWKFGQRKVCLFVTRRCNGLFVEFSVVLFRLRCTELVYMPGRFPEIPEILKVDLKFTPCPDVFADVLKYSITPVNGASVHRYASIISASGSGRPCPCEPQTQLWTLKTEGRTRTVTLNVYETNSALILLVSGNYCIFI